MKKSTNHEGIPGHGGEELIEQISGAQRIHHPIITVNVDDRLVEVENHHNSCHFLSFQTPS